MESEKVKEIKKGLECCTNNKGCEPCPRLSKKPYHLDDCRFALLADILTLINELESENKELRVVTDIANERTYRKKFTDEWRKEYQKELDKQGNGHIAGYPDFDLVYRLYFEQKDRIAELKKEKKELAKQVVKITGCSVSNEEVDYECNKRLKQFVEGLKEKSFYIETIEDTYNVVELSTVYATLKEYVK